MQGPDHPPPIPVSARRDKVRLARTLNLFLPGMGHLCLGRPLRGLFFMTGFLGCFFGIVVLFFRGYLAYFDLTTGDLMQAGAIEGPVNLFAIRWMLVLLFAGLVLFFLSFLGLRQSTSN